MDFTIGKKVYAGIVAEKDSTNLSELYIISRDTITTLSIYFFMI